MTGDGLPLPTNMESHSISKSRGLTQRWALAAIFLGIVVAVSYFGKGEIGWLFWAGAGNVVSIVVMIVVYSCLIHLLVTVVLEAHRRLRSYQGRRRATPVTIRKSSTRILNMPPLDDPGFYGIRVYGPDQSASQNSARNTGSRTPPRSTITPRTRRTTRPRASRIAFLFFLSLLAFLYVMSNVREAFLQIVYTILFVGFSYQLIMLKLPILKPKLTSSPADILLLNQVPQRPVTAPIPNESPLWDRQLDGF